MTKLIGLKSSLDKEQLTNKIVPGLKLLELHLYESDFHDFSNLKNQLLDLNKLYPNLKLMLHAPIIFSKKEYLSLSDYNEDIYYKIYTLCKQLKFVIGFVVHSAYKDQEMELSITNLNKLRDKYKGIDKYIYVENQTHNFSKNKEEWLRFIESAKIERVCFDFAHFTCFYSEQEMLDFIQELKKRVSKIYFHISDNIPKTNNPHPHNLGQGALNLKELKKIIDFGIIETFPKDEQIGKEIKEDYYYFKSL